MVGRDDAIGQAWATLTTGGSVVLEGPTGIGKTAVWQAVLQRARRHDWLVLACAPAETETALPYAALADLLRPLAPMASALPQPQRIAADVVMLAAQPPQPVDERTVAAATRSLLESAPGRRVLVAVDDAQWIDIPSERALRFAIRRLPGLPLLITQRADEPDADLPLGLDRGREPAAPTRIRLGPLDASALHQILHTRLGGSLSRPLSARVIREADGNPLLAIELARAVLRLPRPPLPGEDLPVARSIRQLVADTMAGLPAASRESVRLAALLTVATRGDLAAIGCPPEAYEPAEEVGLVTVTPTGVSFAHPLIAAAVRASIPPGVRRRLHRTLAAAVTDPDERARHLAWGTVEPDAAVAAELTAAAERARTRGAPALAADLYGQAARLTPPALTRERQVRRLDAARCRFDSGDYPAAARAAEELASESTGDLRAEALLLRAMVAWSSDEVGTETAAAIAAAALTAAGADTPLAGRVHVHLGLFVDQPEPAYRHAQTAVALLEGSPADQELLSAALLLQLMHGVRAGRPARTDLLERGLALEGERPSWLAGTVPAVWWKGIDEHDRARDRLEWMLGEAVARGDEPWQHELLAHLGETELLTGRWQAAGRHIRAAQDLGEQLASGLVGENWLVGMLAAYQGRLAQARRLAQEGLQRGAAIGDHWCQRINLHLLGFVELSAGRMAQAAEAYTRLATSCDEVGLLESLSLRFEADWLEACVRAGDIDTATAALDRLAKRHRRLPRPWTELGLARGRLLLAGVAGGDTSAHLDELARVRARLPPHVLPFEQARTLLVAGIAHRRARRKRPAREILAAAVAGFDALGAAAFAATARAELARVGGRPAAPQELTATEDLVARLAAQGRTNRAIAGELFLSPKTVEANLSRIYRKLGVTNRAQLGAAMAGRVNHPPVGPTAQ